MPDKPRNRSGYSTEETLQVESACLTVAVTLGAYLADLCIVGGLVPSLLIDHTLGPDPESQAPHPGTNDLDVALAIALLDDERYAEISHRLRQEGFGPDTNENGNQVLQRWRLGELRVTVDFLMAPAPGTDTNRRIQPLQPDFGALVMPGLELAFDERVDVELEGHTLAGERVVRTIPVCGPGAFIVLKALAFGDRAEPKDAYDLVYVVRRASGGAEHIAGRLAEHAARHTAVVADALAVLSRDFQDPEGLGPQRAATFDSIDPSDVEGAAADAHGHVDDLLTACRSNGLDV
jgi:hypothetical protein